LLAFGLAKSGSDWNDIQVLDIDSGKFLEDKVEWAKFTGISWDGDGFYYSRYDAPEDGLILTAKNEFHKVYYHKIGTPQSEDVLIDVDTVNPLRNRRAHTDEDELYLFVSESDSTYGNALKFRKAGTTDGDFTRILDTFDSENGVVAVVDDKFFIITDKDAPNKRLVVASPENPTPENWKDVVPEADSLLRSVQYIGGNFVVTYLKDAACVAYVFDKTGKKLREIELPTYGVCGFSGEKDKDDFFYSFTSFTYPTEIYFGNINSGESVQFFPSAIKINQDEFVTERVWYTTSSGKKAPIFLTYKNGTVKDGSNPTVLYGYGGFNASMSPSFSAIRLPFIENGGIYAVAVLRGGGEYGLDWYNAGTKMQKQNVFDDFIAAAECLIKEKYTCPDKLAIMGGSNGGLLVGATLTQRPDLFKAAVPAVGVLDMLRYHMFTIGWAWAKDYGTSKDSKEMFEYLLGYSPLHNVKSGVEYPAVLITTSDHDDRVVPAHSFKFAAAMQETATSKNPIFIRVETEAGHGAGKPISKVIDESTDVWAFIMDQLGMKIKP
ncbi:MAG: prolyl oligopeptidase family serine peptidase, partial [Thermoguttaceae bacterium]